MVEQDLGTNPTTTVMHHDSALSALVGVRSFANDGAISFAAKGGDSDALTIYTVNDNVAAVLAPSIDLVGVRRVCDHISTSDGDSTHSMVVQLQGGQLYSVTLLSQGEEVVMW
jgi:hypothetical protein